MIGYNTLKIKTSYDDMVDKKKGDVIVSVFGDCRSHGVLPI